ncbi:MAG: hypothetical protein HeimC3_53160 [Candidatus Heimdallarchaeota archaeon LC_3]|nr:MAG: hypothetical protein HeimC3_53160 [Candidatus Heimdallarchaeota archaeon LC_3]
MREMNKEYFTSFVVITFFILNITHIPVESKIIDPANKKAQIIKTLNISDNIVMWEDDLGNTLTNGSVLEGPNANIPDEDTEKKGIQFFIIFFSLLFFIFLIMDIVIIAKFVKSKIRNLRDLTTLETLVFKYIKKIFIDVRAEDFFMIWFERPEKETKYLGYVYGVKGNTIINTDFINNLKKNFNFEIFKFEELYLTNKNS